MNVVVINYTKRHCPHCGTTFSTVLDGSAIRLGSGRRTCHKCGRQFSDGSAEWADMSPELRRSYLTQGLGSFVFVGLFLEGILLAAVWRDLPASLPFALWGTLVLLGLGALVLGIYYLICWLDIVASKGRRAPCAQSGKFAHSSGSHSGAHEVRTNLNTSGRAATPMEAEYKEWPPSSLGALLAEVRTIGLKCSISTAKTGLFSHVWSSLVFDDKSQLGLLDGRRVSAKTFYRAGLKEKEINDLHHELGKRLHLMGGAGASLLDALETILSNWEARGIIQCLCDETQLSIAEASFSDKSWVRNLGLTRMTKELRENSLLREALGKFSPQQVWDQLRYQVAGAVDDQYQEAQALADRENWPDSLNRLLEQLGNLDPLVGVREFHNSNPTFNLQQVPQQPALSVLAGILRMLLTNEYFLT
jgi:hypothetical protein